MVRPGLRSPAPPRSRAVPAAGRGRHAGPGVRPHRPHHYIGAGGFLPEEGLLAGVDRIRHIPAVIVNGRYDMKTPPEQAWDLHRAWPEAEFHLVEDAGHGGSEPGTLDRLIAATDQFAKR